MTDDVAIDPFGPTRTAGGYAGQFGDEVIPVLTTWKAVRAAARDWERFSNDAPGRIQIPAEDDVRSLRQLPIETDPPLHGAYKDLVKAWFRRPLGDAGLAAQISDLVVRVLGQVTGRGPVDAVSEVALPIQSHALALLLGLPESEAEGWLSWGMHAFKRGGRNDQAAADRLMAMLGAHVDRAMALGGPDFFGHMAGLAFDGRRLTREEMLGFAHVTFAGGRDTVISTLAGAMAHLATHPADRARLREGGQILSRAAEEFVRWQSPLSHLGRVCTGDAAVAGFPRAAGERIALCWAAANFDPLTFDAPEELRIDRAPNPHVGFGAGDHACLGAAHARAVIRAMLEALSDPSLSLAVQEIVPGRRDIGGQVRRHGFERVILSFDRM